MQRAKQPSTPTQELADRRGWTGPTLADGVLTADLAAFCQSGLSVVMASRDSAGRPVVARGLACRLDARGRIRVIYREAANHGFQRAIAAGAQIAATFTRPYSHRSIQLKAARADIVRLSPQDGPAAFVQARAFRDELVSVGYAEALASGYTRFEPHELAAVEFLPEAAFVQTPGPSAGSALSP